MTNRKSLVVSMGEPAGIGPDIILSAWIKRKALNLPEFFVFGNFQCLIERAAQLKIDVPVVEISNGFDAVGCFEHGLPVLQSVALGPVVAGQLSDDSGSFVIDAIKRSVRAIYEGEASAMVTAPIHKAALYGVGFSFPGHTEYLSALSSEVFDKTATPVMMLASDELRVVPLTIHVPLKDVPELLNIELIVETTSILAHDLQRRFGIADPRIIITGLNPHAGEDGTMGREEIETIIPAIKALKNKGLDVTGPYPADTCFHKKARKGYDAAIAMYHDQALIPIKTLSFDEGVNVTLGLPFIRTSPDHGTALSIAGSGLADPLSFISALRMADDMAIRSELKV